MSRKLKTMDAETLMTTPMEPLKFIVSGLLPEGLHVLAGSPKIGKSWLALWICLQVAKGEKVWGFETLRSKVLYLCLEDSFVRIQSRLFEITDEAPSTLHFAIMSDAIGHGLENQIESFIKEHPGTGLIVIDTLQKVRKTVSANVNPYASDYDDINALKQISDRHHLAILLVHHLRKTGDADPLNMIRAPVVLLVVLIQTLYCKKISELEIPQSSSAPAGISRGGNCSWSSTGTNFYGSCWNRLKWGR